MENAKWYLEILKQFMSGIVSEYFPFPLPDPDRNLDFQCNLFSIFLKALEGCVQNPKELGKTINKNKTKLEMYVAYCRNKPFSEYLVHSCSQYFEEIRMKLNQRLSVKIHLFLIYWNFKYF